MGHKDREYITYLADSYICFHLATFGKCDCKAFPQPNPIGRLAAVVSRIQSASCVSNSAVSLCTSRRSVCALRNKSSAILLPVVDNTVRQY